LGNLTDLKKEKEKKASSHLDKSLDANILPSTGHSSTKKEERTKERSGLALHLIFHRFSLFNYCLSVVL